MRMTKSELAEDLLKGLGKELWGVAKYGGKEILKLSEGSAGELGRFAIGETATKRCKKCNKRRKVANDRCRCR